MCVAQHRARALNRDGGAKGEVRQERMREADIDSGSFIPRPTRRPRDDLVDRRSTRRSRGRRARCGFHATKDQVRRLLQHRVGAVEWCYLLETICSE